MADLMNCWTKNAFDDKKCTAFIQKLLTCVAQKVQYCPSLNRHPLCCPHPLDPFAASLPLPAFIVLAMSHHSSDSCWAGTGGYLHHQLLTYTLPSHTGRPRAPPAQHGGLPAQPVGPPQLDGEITACPPEERRNQPGNRS